MTIMKKINIEWNGGLWIALLPGRTPGRQSLPKLIIDLNKEGYEAEDMTIMFQSKLSSDSEYTTAWEQKCGL